MPESAHNADRQRRHGRPPSLPATEQHRQQKLEHEPVMQIQRLKKGDIKLLQRVQSMQIFAYLQITVANIKVRKKTCILRSCLAYP